MKNIAFLSCLFLALFLLSPGHLYSQTKLPVDSIPNYIKPFISNDSTCLGQRSDLPSCWFELRNTALGVVIYEGDNSSFNIQFIDSNRLIEWEGQERATRRIDSVLVSGKLTKIYCSTKESWGWSRVVYELTLIDPISQITHLKKTYLTIVTGVGVGELSREKWVLPYSAERKYYILTDPKGTLADSLIPFLPMDKNKLKLFR